MELFENAAATAAGLFAIILMFGPVSGAHFNPVVSFVDAAFGGLRWRHAAAYLPAQVAGCVGGAVVANLMFSQAAVSISTKHRASGAHFLSEVVATLGLLLVIFALARTGRSRSAPAAVGAYIGAAYFFTSSTSFANPAITVGRMFSNTFAGIAPSSAPTFIAAQVVGGVLAVVVIKALYPKLTPAEAAEVIVPHPAASSGDSPKATGRSGRSRVSATSPLEGVPVSQKPAVLFLCVHNAGRSLAARVLLDHYAEGRVDVFSAGSEPADQLNPSVVAMLRRTRSRPEPGVPQARSPTRPLRPPTSSSPWAAATPARCTPASGTSTGISKTRPACRSTPFVPSSKRSTVGSAYY